MSRSPIGLRPRKGVIPAFARTSIVVRAGWKGARWLDAKGKPVDLLATLATAANAGVLDCPIWIGRKTAAPLALRLVAFRKPAAAAEISRAKARCAKGRQRHPRRHARRRGMGHSGHLSQSPGLVQRRDRRSLPRPSCGTHAFSMTAYRDGFQAPEEHPWPGGTAGRRPENRQDPRSSRGQALDPGSSADGSPARAAHKRARNFSPPGRITAPALWRLTCLAAKALLAAIMPTPQSLHPSRLRRHLLEPPRTRCYQTIPALC
jgi:hypothetical protein